MGRTLAARVIAVLRVVWLVSALPLDYRGKLRILRTMYVPAALHGIEASLLSQSNLVKLRLLLSGLVGLVSLRCRILALCWACWMGLSVLIRVLVLFGSGFGCCVGILLIDLLSLLGLGGFWRWLVMGHLGMGLCISWLIVLLLWGFGGFLVGFAGVGLVYLICLWLTGPPAAFQGSYTQCLEGC